MHALSVCYALPAADRYNIYLLLRSLRLDVWDCISSAGNVDRLEKQGKARGRRTNSREKKDFATGT